MEEPPKNKRKAFKRRPKTEEEKAVLSAKSKANWADPTYQQKQKEGWEAAKDTMIANGKAAGPLISAKVKASWEKPGRKEAASEIYKKSWANDTERKEKASNRTKATWADPVKNASIGAAISAANSTEEAKARISANFTALWQTDGHREKMSAKTTRSWQNQSYRDSVVKNSSRIQRPNDFLLLIKDLEDGKGSVSGLCEKYDFSHTFMLKFLRANNMDDLIGANRSTPQREIADYIRSLGFDIETDTRKVIAPLELDIYIPEKKFAIEFNGLYWHSSAAPNHKRGRHVVKAKRCQDAGVKLFAIFEDEWDCKQDLIKSMIAHKLGVANGINVGARKTTVVSLSAKECKEFHDKFHLDGGLSYKGYGLEYDGKIIAAISLRKFTRAPYQGFTEVARFACDTNYIIPGAMSKLLKVVKGGIVSYSNNRVGSGNVYSTLNFVEDTVSTAASYWYTDFNTRVWRTRCQRVNTPEILKLFPSEEEQAKGGVFSYKLFGDDRQLYRVEDYGSKRWILKQP